MRYHRIVWYYLSIDHTHFLGFTEVHMGEQKLKQKNQRNSEHSSSSTTSTATCQCKNDNLFSPIKSKMKVLKKIKRRMGLGLYQQFYTYGYVVFGSFDFISFILYRHSHSIQFVATSAVVVVAAVKNHLTKFLCAQRKQQAGKRRRRRRRSK